MNRKAIVGALIGVFVLAAPAAVIRVDQNAPGPTHDGSSWATAFLDIQDALNLPPADGDQIWVADGTYTPSVIVGPSGATDPRYKTFLIPPRVSVYGGFQGVSGPYPSGESFLIERDPEKYFTILSGDLNNSGTTPGDDPPNYDTFPNDDPDDPNVLGDPFGTYSNNVFHVVTFFNPILPDTKLSGFVIQGGFADGASTAQADQGGGINITNFGVDGPLDPMDPNSPIVDYGVYLNRLRVHHNYAYHGGGGLVFRTKYQQIYATNCLFDHNITELANGGGILMRWGNLIAQNCVFNANEVWRAFALLRASMCGLGPS